MSGVRIPLVPLLTKDNVGDKICEGSALSIRTVEEEDISRVLELVNQDYEQFFNNQEPLTEEVYRRWMNEGDTSGYRFYIAEINNEIAGYLSFREGEDAYLGMIATNPTFRRRRIASQLVTFALGHLRVNGSTRAHLEIREDNIACLRLINSLGFVVERRLEEEMDDGTATYVYAINLWHLKNKDEWLNYG